jgi:integrase
VKAIVRIPHIAWRDGRPRFSPGPAPRALGFAGEDLRHGKNGPWFSLRECEDWARARTKQIAEKRAEPILGSKSPRTKRAPARRRAEDDFTLDDLFEELFASKHFRAKAPATRRDYRLKARAFASFAPALADVPAGVLTPQTIVTLHEQLWEAKGHAMANGMIAVLRLAYSLAIQRGKGRIAVNPCRDLRLPTPKPRLRCASRAEIDALIAAADEIEPSVGDAILLALYTGQRQGDVLALTEQGVEDGRIKLRQRKTGARVSVFALPRLVARLAAIRERNRAAGVVAATIVAHPRTHRQWDATNFRHRFAEVRFEAQELCHSLEDFHFADLRDTAVTWLHNAGCTITEIASVTGHSEKSVYTVLKHYLVIDETTNDRAMGKLGAWLEKEG